VQAMAPKRKKYGHRRGFRLDVQQVSLVFPKTVVTSLARSRINIPIFLTNICHTLAKPETKEFDVNVNSIQFPSDCMHFVFRENGKQLLLLKPFFIEKSLKRMTTRENWPI
jgi:hypothetical protein